jgi:hypothetical protein
MYNTLAWTPLVGSEYKDATGRAVIRRVTAIVGDTIHYEYGMHFNGRWETVGTGKFDADYFTGLCLPAPSGPLITKLAAWEAVGQMILAHTLPSYIEFEVRKLLEVPDASH